MNGFKWMCFRWLISVIRPNHAGSCTICASSFNRKNILASVLYAAPQACPWIFLWDEIFRSREKWVENSVTTTLTTLAIIFFETAFIVGLNADVAPWRGGDVGLRKSWAGHGCSQEGDSLWWLHEEWLSHQVCAIHCGKGAEKSGRSARAQKNKFSSGDIF